MRLRSMLEKLIREWLPRLCLRNLRSRLEMWWMFWRIWWRRFQGGWVRAIRWVCENWGLSAWVCPVRESKSRRNLIRERSRRKLFFCLPKVLNLNWKRSLLSIKNSSSAFLFFFFFEMKIIGITWPQAAWKGAVVDYLVKNYAYAYFSVSGYLTQELQAQGQAVNRDTMRELANQLRSEFWPSFIVEQLYHQAHEAGKPAIIESIRALGELETLKKKADFLLLSIDADQRLRYERALLRNSEKDQVSREKFQEQEALEADTQDPAKQNVPACQKLADIQIDNNGSLEQLYEQIDRVVWMKG